MKKKKKKKEDIFQYRNVSSSQANVINIFPIIGIGITIIGIGLRKKGGAINK